MQWGFYKVLASDHDCIIAGLRHNVLVEMSCTETLRHTTKDVSEGNDQCLITLWDNKPRKAEKSCRGWLPRDSEENTRKTILNLGAFCFLGWWIGECVQNDNDERAGPVMCYMSFICSMLSRWGNFQGSISISLYSFRFWKNSAMTCMITSSCRWRLRAIAMRWHTFPHNCIIVGPCERTNHCYCWIRDEYEE